MLYLLWHNVNIRVVRQIFLKSLKLFFHTLWQTVLNLGPAWLADVCAAKNINEYSNKPAKGYERIIQRFSEDMATLKITIF